MSPWTTRVLCISMSEAGAQARSESLRYAAAPCGDHEVIYAGADEVIEFKHTAYSKDRILAKEPWRQPFLAGKPAGRYDMSDVIQF